MYKKRTDLAIEAKEIVCGQADKITKLDGVEADDYEKKGFKISKVRITNRNGEQKLGKPMGNYVTVDLMRMIKREDQSFHDAALVISDEIRQMIPIPQRRLVLIAGLGNRFITADAIGPQTIEHVMVTRHLVENMPSLFSAFSKTAAISPGVLGLTGVETGEILRGVCQRVSPSAIIVIDALASRKVSRLCTNIQISDTGIVPGSGVGNSRNAITKETFGIPVVAMGVPTVVDAGTLASDIAEEAGADEKLVEKLTHINENLVVTPKDIDKYISDTSKVLGYAINFALHDHLTLNDMELFLS